MYTQLRSRSSCGARLWSERLPAVWRLAGLSGVARPNDTGAVEAWNRAVGRGFGSGDGGGCCRQEDRTRKHLWGIARSKSIRFSFAVGAGVDESPAPLSLIKCVNGGKWGHHWSPGAGSCSGGRSVCRASAAADPGKRTRNANATCNVCGTCVTIYQTKVVV
jgi:hypothetical protein